MRSPARRAHHRELLHAQRVRDAGHIVGRRCHVSAAVGAGAAIAGPGVGDQPDVACRGGRDHRLQQLARLGRAVMPEQRQRRAACRASAVVRTQESAVSAKPAVSAVAEAPPLGAAKPQMGDK